MHYLRRNFYAKIIQTYTQPVVGCYNGRDAVHGIAADRLTPKGYGEGKPKTIKRKVAERYEFLKEGDVLTEDYITQLPEDQQEQCNQLNRRTEFKVLRTTYGMFDTEGKLIQRPQPKEAPQDSEEPQSSEPW